MSEGQKLRLIVWLKKHYCGSNPLTAKEKDRLINLVEDVKRMIMLEWPYA